MSKHNHWAGPTPVGTDAALVQLAAAYRKRISQARDKGDADEEHRFEQRLLHVQAIISLRRAIDTESIEPARRRARAFIRFSGDCSGGG